MKLEMKQMIINTKRKKKEQRRSQEKKKRKKRDEMVGRWMFEQATNVRVHSRVEEFVTCDGALRQQANSAAKHDSFCSALCSM